MATLEDEIRDLKAEIAEYGVKLRAATSTEDLRIYANLITAKEARLLFLLQQQLPQGGGQGRHGRRQAYVEPLPPDISALFQEPDTPESVFYKFQFNQRGGRMQVKGVADGMGVGGRIKRTSLHWLQCVVVFSLPLNKELVMKFLEFARSLPSFRDIEKGISCLYSCYLGKFEILKTRPTILKEVLNNYHSDSEEPENAPSDISSALSVVSGTSSHT